MRNHHYVSISLFRGTPKMDLKSKNKTAIWWGEPCKQWVIGNETMNGTCMGYYKLNPETNDEMKCIEDSHKYGDRVNEEHLCVLKPMSMNNDIGNHSLFSKKLCQIQ